ncbi:hypothetical protein M231_01105 [Tremella mesenterica]|uniref:Ribosomal RNA-processing protein 40 n=1 Tax=Tremella mesenterica TaxID=5217 RepID=A0A4Q1BU80_TREME|nr:hypothetical protein M231_01105 [Tremella mesenterica]
MSQTIVLPGDRLYLPESSFVTLGPGIASSSRSGNSTSDSLIFIATKLGVLSSVKGKEKARIWVETRSKRYIPAQKDLVIGTIIARHADGYRVDIGSAQMAQLDALAFESATKRSKPNLKIGTLVYGRVTLANRDMDPEIECFDPSTGKSEGFGELKEGLMVECSLQLCRQLLKPKYPLLLALASQVKFEIAIGLNGRIWLKASSVGETIALKRVIAGVNEGKVKVEKDEIVKLVKEYLA